MRGYITSPPYTEPQISECSESTEKISVSEKEIMIICSSLDLNESKVAEQLQPILLQKLSFALNYSLAQIFRKIVCLCTFPNFRRTALVSPLFEKGDSSDVSNYQPVLLLCITPKFF